MIVNALPLSLLLALSLPFPPPRSSAAQGYQRARRVARKTAWRDARYCVLDLEMTGLDPEHDEIVAWAAVPVEDGRVVLGGAAEGPGAPERRDPAGDGAPARPAPGRPRRRA